MNRLQSDGKLRDSDNWQKGIPMDVYMKSGYRHFNDWWAGHRYGDTPMIDRKPTMAALCGLLFNVMGYMHEELKRHPEVDFDGDNPTPEMKRRQDTVKFLELTACPADVVFLDTDDPENIEKLKGLQEEDAALRDRVEPVVNELKCGRCRSVDKTWDEWPCSECTENHVDLFNKGPFNHCYFSARQDDCIE
jgi:hypothetical protein